MANRTDVFDLIVFFNGPIEAHGLFEDRFGVVRRRFKVAMEGRREDAVLILTEHFIYDDGERQERVWRMTPGPAGAFTATAPDIIGIVRGTATADTATMTYKHEVRMEGRGVVLSFADRLHRLDGDTAISRAVVTKWGIRVGEVSIFFCRLATPADDSIFDHAGSIAGVDAPLDQPGFVKTY